MPGENRTPATRVSAPPRAPRAAPRAAAYGVAWLFGAWAAIALHVLVDVYAFGVESMRGFPWVGEVLDWMLLANLAVTFLVALYGAGYLGGLLEAKRAAPRS